MTRFVCTLFLILSCLVLLVAAQQDQSQPVPLFRSRVDLVVLDVSVLDHDRRPVRGLTARDFTVLEDDRQQAVTMFSAIDIPDPPTPTAPWLRDIAPDVRRNVDDAPGQLVLLLLDDANPLSADAMMRAKTAARSVIDRLGPVDLGAVAFVADARSGQEFTHDRARLLAAIDRFGSPDSGGFPGALAMLGPTMTLRSLAAQAEAMGDVSTRRKVIVFISARGAAVPGTVAGDARPAEQGQDTPGAIDAPGLTVAALGEFGQFVRAAQRANVAVYCVDPGGLRAPETRSPAFGSIGGASSIYVHDPNATGVASLLTLSVNTGAFAIVETNDPQPGLTQAFRENRSYYLLAYASTNDRTEGRFRRIRVRIDRPGVMARTRTGYFEPAATDVKRRAEQPATAAAVLSRVVARDDIPMSITAAPFAVEGRPDAVVAIVVRVQQAAADAVRGLDLDVRAVDYMAKERASERVRVKIGVRPGSQFDLEYDVLSRLELKPGRYQLRVAAVERAGPAGPGAAQAKAGRAGSVFCDLDVPDFGRAALSLSGLVVSETSGILVAPNDRLAAILPVVPTTERAFRATDRVAVFFRVYQGGAGPVTPVDLRFRVIDMLDATVVDAAERLGADRFARGRAADVQREVPLARLKPGEYLLSVEAKRGEAAARRDVRLAVQ